MFNSMFCAYSKYIIIVIKKTFTYFGNSLCQKCNKIKRFDKGYCRNITTLFNYIVKCLIFNIFVYEVF